MVAAHADIEPGGPLECPEWLDDTARLEWARIVPLISRYAIAVDIALIATYCQAYANWQHAQAELKAHGLLNDKGNLNPAARYSVVLMTEIRRLASEFGFSPAARMAKDLAPTGRKGDQEREDLEGFLGE